MAPRGGWALSPDSGGKKIPEHVKRDVETRIRRVAEKHFEGRYTRLDVRFRAQFCYIDAYEEPVVEEGWPPKDWPESREEYLERLRATPTRLCRLRHFGHDRWGFAFYKYSDERYEMCVFPNGEFLGTPEDAFLVSGNVYLAGK